MPAPCSSYSDCSPLAGATDWCEWEHPSGAGRSRPWFVRDRIPEAASGEPGGEPVPEQNPDIDGATVHVVPDDFDCEAVRKGRAIELARRTLACEREVALSLDEDSLVTEFEGLPVADIVQIQERPRRTDSYLTYLADTSRMGLHFEQRAFERLGVPLYAWAGGLAARKSIEDEIPWDRASRVEDTAFVWRAVLWAGAEYRLSEAAFADQAPPSFTEILEQRRRWIAGNHQEAGVLPRRYRWVAGFRNVGGSLSPVAPFTFQPSLPLGVQVLSVALLTPVAVRLALWTFGWFLGGRQFYDLPPLEAVGAVVLAPVASVVHSPGVFVCLVRGGLRVPRRWPRRHGSPDDRGTDHLDDVTRNEGDQPHGQQLDEGRRGPLHEGQPGEQPGQPEPVDDQEVRHEEQTQQPRKATGRPGPVCHEADERRGEDEPDEVAPGRADQVAQTAGHPGEPGEAGGTEAGVEALTRPTPPGAQDDAGQEDGERLEGDGHRRERQGDADLRGHAGQGGEADGQAGALDRRRAVPVPEELPAGVPVAVPRRLDSGDTTPTHPIGRNSSRLKSVPFADGEGAVPAGG